MIKLKFEDDRIMYFEIGEKDNPIYKVQYLKEEKVFDKEKRRRNWN